MLHGLYSSAVNLAALGRQQEAIASNLAHVNTPGHRRLVFAFSEHSRTESQPAGHQEKLVADFGLGRIESTGRPLDLALGNQGFFSYRGANGDVYSRNGVLFRNPENNQLVNGDGLPLLSDSGEPVTYEGPLSELNVAPDGTLSRRGESVGKIGIVTFNDNLLLESENQTYFRAGQATIEPATGITVSQGYRELSNAHPVTELIALMVGSRNFEASQKAIHSLSEAMQQNARS